MKNSLTTILFIFFASWSLAQPVVIWEENFVGYPNGATSGDGWSASASDCDDGSPGSGSSQYGVIGGQFVWEDIEGTCDCGVGGRADNTWETSDIPINGCNVTVSLLVGGRLIGADNFECSGSPGFPCDNQFDQMIVEYSLDGGGYVGFNGNGYFCNENGGNRNFVASGLSGSTLRIRVTAGNKENGELFFLDNILVIGNPAATVTVTGPSTICEGDEITLTASAGFESYQWSNGDSGQSINVTQAGTYIVTATSAGGCTSIRPFAVAPAIVPDVAITAIPSTTACSDGSANITLSATPGFATYDWSNGDSGRNITVDAGGTYTVVATSTSGCTDEAEVTIDEAQRPTIDPIGLQQACQFYELPEITGNNLINPAYYAAPNGLGQRFEPGEVITTNRILYAFDGSLGCSDQEQVTINILPPPTFVNVMDREACETYTLEPLVGAFVTANRGYYTQPNAGGTELTAGSVITTSQTIYAYDESGNCVTDVAFNVTINTPPDVDDIPDANSCLFYVLPSISGTNLSGNEAYFTATGGTGTQFNAGDTIFNNTTLFIYDGVAGCDDEESFTITITAGPDVDDLPDQTVCASFTLPDISGTNLSGNEAYYTEPNGGGTMLMPGEVINTSQTLYIFDSDGSCSNEESFDIFIANTPDISPIANQTGCGFVILPAINGTDLTGGEAYYTATGGTGTRFNPGDTVFISMPMFIYDGAPGCEDEESFSVNILPVPVLDSIPDQEACGFFTLPEITGTNLSGNEAYYTEPGGNGTRINAGDAITGTDTLFVYDTNGICDDEISFIVTINEEPIIDEPGTQAGCEFYVLPPITGFALSGNEAYFTEPNGGGAMLMPGDTIRNNTTLFIFDDNGACTTEASFDIIINDLPNITVTSQNVTCNAADDGAIELTVTGAAPFTFDWDIDTLDGQQNTTGLPAGIYNITVTDNQLCSVSTQAIITEPEALTLACSEQSPVSGTGLSDGIARIILSGGTANYTVTWTGPASGNQTLTMPDTLVINNLPAGAYEVTVTDANGCAQTCNFAINVLGCDITLDMVGQDASCPDADDGAIDVTITGGTAPFTFDWSDDALDGTQSPTGLAVGNYVLTVIDANNCVVSSNIDINARLTPPTANVSAGGIACGDACYTFNLNYTGVPPFVLEYEVNDGTNTRIETFITNQTNPVLNICPADFNMGTDTVTLTFLNLLDGNCLADLSQTETVVFLPNSQDTIMQTLCDGESIMVNGVTYDQTNPSGTETITGGAANGCDSIIVVELSFLPPAIFDLNQTLCAGESITVNGTVYDQNNPAGTEILAGASANGCDSTINVNLNFFAPAIFDLNPTLCAGESVIVNGNVYDQSNPGGTEILAGASANGCDSTVNINLSFFAPATFDLNQTLCAGESITVNGNVYDQSNPVGTEILAGASVNGCDSTVNINLSFFAPAIFDLNQTLCEGESITVNGDLYDQNNPTGTEILAGASVNGCDSTVNINLTYIFPAQTVIDSQLCSGEFIAVNGVTYDVNNPSGTETIAGGAANGCDSIIQVSLRFIDPPVFDLAQTLCPGESITVNGNVYDQTNPSGTEILAGASAEGCDSTVNVNLSFFAPAIFDLNQTLCTGESITVNGTVYDQNNPSGTEILTGASVNGCDSVVNVNLDFFAPAIFDLNQTLCAGESITVNGAVYDQNTPSGTETLAGASINGCDSIVNINLDFFAPAIFDLNQTLCEGESITVNGAVYDQNNPNGTEILAGASVNGCDSTVNINLTFVFPSVNNLETTLCNGESLVINGVTYDANNPSGTETIVGGAANGCDSIINVNLSFFPAITAAIEGSTSICAGETATLTFRFSGASMFDVRYSDGTNPAVELTNIVDGHTIQVSPTMTSTYTIEFIAVDGSACSAQIGSSATIEVSNLTAAAVAATDFGGFGVSCANSTDGVVSVISNDGIAPFNYNWNTGANTQQLNGVGAGTYTVTVTDAVGCEATSSVSLTAPQPITVSNSTRDPLCSGDRSGAIIIDNITGGAPPYEVSLDGQSFRAINGFPYELSGLEAGNYNVFVRDINDCNVQFNASIVAISDPSVELGDNIVVALGDSVEIEGLVNFTPSKIEWSPTDFLSSPDMLRTFVTPSESTTYTLTVSDTSGCVATDQIIILVNRERKVFIPTAFSPDGDGNNDVFYIYGGNDVVRIKNFIVFDRWGNQMFLRDEFLPNDPLFGWDGTFNGRDVSIGVYTYYAEIEFIDGFIEVFKGDVTVVR